LGGGLLLLTIKVPLRVSIKAETYKILERLAGEYELDKWQVVERAIRVFNRRGKDMLYGELPRNY